MKSEEQREQDQKHLSHADDAPQSGENVVIQ